MGKLIFVIGLNANIEMLILFVLVVMEYDNGSKLNNAVTYFTIFFLFGIGI